MVQPGICHSYKRELYEGIHQRTDDYRIALFPATADLSRATDVYTPEQEITGQGYTAGGKSLTGFRAALDEDVAILDFDDPVWTNATITARAALIYNATRNNRAVAVLDFGEQAGSLNGNFRAVFPRPTGQTALIRLR